MIVWISQNSLNTRLRELNNLGHLSDSELMVTFDRHLRKLGDHLREYGLKFVDLNGLEDGAPNDLAAIEWVLSPSYSESDRQARLDGARFLGPLAVTVQRNDVPALVLNRVAIAGITQVWNQVAPTMERVQVGEVEQLLESAAMASLNGAVVQGHVGEFDEYGLSEDANFKLWCVRNNLEIPGAARRNAEIAAANQERARKDAESKAIADRIAEQERNSSGGSWGVREIT